MIHLFLTKLEKLQQRFLYWRNFTQFRQLVEKPKRKRKKKRICEITIVFKTIGLASNSNKFLTFSLTCSQIWLSLLLWRIASVCRWNEQQAVLERQSDLLLLLLLLLLPILSQGFVVFNFVKLVDWWSSRGRWMSQSSCSKFRIPLCSGDLQELIV